MDTKLATQNQASQGEFLTILSIDGGGIRGVIPAIILEYLEEQLQILDGPNARIADYFDVVAGTSTGGLIAGILTAPDDKGRPRYTTQDAMKFYTRDGTKIFPNRAFTTINQLVAPKHDASFLETLLNENLKDLKIKDTVTEVFIPTFDIKLMQPTYFSTTEAKKEELKNAYMRDVLRGTSAAPTYFAPHFFNITSTSGESKDYNLVDGGVGMNNPALLSILHNIQQKVRKTKCNKPKTLEDCKNLLVLSLGTGKVARSYSARDASNWGITSWVLKDGHTPIMDIVGEASADMVDYNLFMLFNTLDCPHNYLRIQAFDIPKEAASLDDATSENIERLKEVGEKLLNMPVSRVNIESGEPLLRQNQGTNKDALKRFAKRLSKEYHARGSSSI